MMHPRLRRAPLACALASVLLLSAQPGLAGTVTGRLLDGATGQPLADARVSIAGSAFATRTDADGRYVLRDVPAGRYSLSSDGASQAVDVPAVGEVEANLTTGKADARELGSVVVAQTRREALDLQMAADNTVNVLSAQDLKTTAVHNVAEALGLMPGVNVFATGASYIGGIDGPSRGEGRFTSIRGLNAEYNVNTVNGVTVASAQPFSRGVELALLPPSGLQTIELNKTSLPYMDGDAIGGSLDYRTPSAFNFRKNTGGSVALSARMESQARRYGDKGLGYGGAAEFQTKFGADHNIGLYLNVFGDTREFVNSQMTGATNAKSDGGWKWRYAARVGTSNNYVNYPGLDPQQNLAQSGMSVGASGGKVKRYGGSASLDYRINNLDRVYAQATYAKADTEHDSTLIQLFGGASYTLVPGSVDKYQPAITNVSYRVWEQTNPELASLGTFKLGYAHNGQHWKVEPSVFYSKSRNDRPYHVEISARSNQSATTFPVNPPLNDFTVMQGNGFPVPVMTPELAAQVAAGIGNLPGRRWGDQNKQFSRASESGAKVDAGYYFDSDSGVREVQFGLRYAVSRHDFREIGFEGYNVSGTPRPIFADYGILRGNYDTAFPGYYDWAMPRIDRDALKAQITAHAPPITDGGKWNCGPFIEDINNCGHFRATESVGAGYLQMRFTSGDVEFLPGFRFEHAVVHNRSWGTESQDGDNTRHGQWFETTSRFTEFLPSVHVNYRPDNGNLVVRGAVWTSYVRPPYVQLGGARSNDLDKDGVNRYITEGNPFLKPIRAVNFDLGAQWANPTSGSDLYVSLFHKRLRNYIYEFGTDRPYADSTDPSGKVFYSKPLNGGKGQVQGIELGFQQRLAMMSDGLKGLGVGLNVTRQKTKVDLGLPGYHAAPIQNAPEVLGNAELFYEYAGFSANLSYHYSGAYISQYRYLGGQAGNWDDLWVRPARRVDLHLGYTVRDSLSFDLSCSNLTNQHGYWAHIGKDSLRLSDIVDTGRTWLFTTKYTF